MPRNEHCLERILAAVKNGAENWKDVHEKTGIKLRTIYVIACMNKIPRPTLRSRYEILLREGYTINRIAEAEGASYITIYQRIARNGLIGLYHKMRFPEPESRCVYGRRHDPHPRVAQAQETLEIGNHHTRRQKMPAQTAQIY